MQALFEKIQPQGESFLLRERCEPRFAFRWHFHPEFELTAVVEGRGTRFVGDSIEPYGPGDLVLLGPQLPHTWASAPQGSRRNRAVYAQFSAAGGVPAGGSAGGQAGGQVAGLSGVLGLSECASVRALLERAGGGLAFGGRQAGRAAERLLKAADLRGTRRLCALLEILDDLAALRGGAVRTLASRAFAPALNRSDQRRVDAVCRHIAEHLCEPLAQPAMARLAHLSVPAFCRLFRRTLGKTFTAYVNELRVGHACRRLIESDASVSAVAFESGFENLSNFNRRFRALKGLTPRDFRARYAPS